MTQSVVGLRQRIDQLDHQPMVHLQHRFELARAVGRLKQVEGHPIVQPERVTALFADRTQQATELGLDPGFVSAVWQLIHEESCRQQALVWGDRTPPLPDTKDWAESVESTESLKPAESKGGRVGGMGRINGTVGSAESLKSIGTGSTTGVT